MTKYLLLLLSITANIQGFSQNQDWGNLKKYAMENQTLKTPANNEKRVVFMGNSITEGWKQADSVFFSRNNYVDRGISGQTTPQMLLRFRQDVINLKPSTVVILAGINDIAENTGPISLDDILGNIISMAELARSNNIRVILCSVLPANRFPWRPHIKPAEKVMKLNSMIKAYATENKITYVDYYSSLVDGEKGLDKKFTEDGVHPTITGYKIMVPIIVRAINNHE